MITIKQKSTTKNKTRKMKTRQELNKPFIKKEERK